MENSYNSFFLNLANPLKRAIILGLMEKEKNVSQLSKNLKIEQSKLSHALSSLKECRIVEVKQKGKERIYSLNKKTIVPILKLIDKHSHSFCKKNCSECYGCGKEGLK